MSRASDIAALCYTLSAQVKQKSDRGQKFGRYGGQKSEIGSRKSEVGGRETEERTGNLDLSDVGASGIRPAPTADL